MLKPWPRTVSLVLIIALVAATAVPFVKAQSPLPPGWAQDCTEAQNALTPCGCYQYTTEQTCSVYSSYCKWQDGCVPGSPPVPGGASCNTLLTDIECFRHYDQCSWSLASNLCLDQPAATCADYSYNIDPCWAAINNAGVGETEPICIIDNGWCINPPVACTNLTTSDCALRSDCHWQDSINNCAPGPPVNGCALQSTASSCRFYACFWDNFLNQCLNSASEVSNLFPCSHWTNWPTADYACEYHGCESAGSLCFNVGSGVGQTDNSTSVQLSVNANFVNPRMIDGTMVFSVDVVIPFAFHEEAPQWPFLSIGNPWSLAPNVAITPGFCNSATGNPTSYPARVVYPDFVALADDFMNFVNANNNYDFSTLPPEDTYKQLFNTMLTGPGKLISNITVTNPAESIYTADRVITYTMQFDVNDAVNYCPEAYRTVEPGHTIYSFPLEFSVMTLLGSIAQAKQHFYVDQSTGGALVIGSSAVRRTSVGRTTSIPVPCEGTNRQRLNITYEIITRDAVNPARFVGPRGINDFSWNAFAPVSDPVLRHCYGDHAIELIDLGVSNHIHKQLLVTQTQCRTVDPTGDSFNECVYADASDTPVDGWPVALDAVHTFWVNSYSCPIGDLTDQSCLLVNADSSGAPDQILSVITQKVYPNSEQQNNQLHVVGSLLPTPFAPLADELVMFKSDNGVVTYTVNDTRNTQLTYNKSLSVVVHLDEGTLDVFDLNISISNFSITPIDHLGDAITTNRVLYMDWYNMNILAHDTPKNFVVCSNCRRLLACDGHKGCDGFSLSVADLYTYIPANGYRVKLQYDVNVVQNSTSGLVHNRRLLQAGGVTVGQAYTTSGTLQVAFMIDGVPVSTQYGFAELDKNFGMPRWPYLTATLIVAFSAVVSAGLSFGCSKAYASSSDEV